MATTDPSARNLGGNPPSLRELEQQLLDVRALGPDDDDALFRKADDEHRLSRRIAVAPISNVEEACIKLRVAGFWLIKEYDPDDEPSAFKEITARCVWDALAWLEREPEAGALSILTRHVLPALGDRSLPEKIRVLPPAAVAQIRDALMTVLELGGGSMEEEDELGLSTSKRDRERKMREAIRLLDRLTADQPAGEAAP
jgi:hypothetical protein